MLTYCKVTLVQQGHSRFRFGKPRQQYWWNKLVVKSSPNPANSTQHAPTVPAEERNVFRISLNQLAVPAAPLLSEHAQRKLSELQPDLLSATTRYLYYYGIDAICIARVSSFALDLLSGGKVPSVLPEFQNLFISESPLLLNVRALAERGVYIPEPAIRLETELSLSFVATAAKAERGILVLNPDYFNLLFNADPKQPSIPQILLRRSWALADFDDNAKAAILLEAGLRLWNAAAKKFERHSDKKSTAAPAQKLLLYYHSLAEEIRAKHHLHLQQAQRLLQAASNSQLNRNSGDPLSVDETRLQLAALHLEHPERAHHAKQTLEHFGNGNPLNYMALRAQDILGSKPTRRELAWAQTLTAPNTEALNRDKREDHDKAARIPERNKLDRKAPNLDDEHKLMLVKLTKEVLDQDPQVRLGAAKAIRCLSKDLPTHILRNAAKILYIYDRVEKGFVKFESALDALENEAPDSEAYKQAKETLLVLSYQAPRPVSQAAKDALKLLQQNDGTTASLTFEFRPREWGDTEPVRDGLAHAYKHSSNVEIELRNGRALSGRIAYGSLDQPEVRLFDIVRNRAENIALIEIQKLKVFVVSTDSEHPLQPRP